MNRSERRRLAQRLATRETAVVHRVAGLLLEYPGAELLSLVPTMRAATAELPERQRAPLVRVLGFLDAHEPADLESRYVETFDLRRKHALYLTYFAYGDTRKRGLGLVTFTQAYRRAGFEVVRGELPDHLAVVLEFASSGDAVTWAAGIELLLEHRAGLELLRLALVDADSPWAGALEAVSATLPDLGRDERRAVAELAAAGPPEEDVGLDAYPRPVSLPDPRTRTAALEGARR